MMKIGIVISKAHEVYEVVGLKKILKCFRCKKQGTVEEIYNEDNKCIPHLELSGYGWKHEG